MRIALPIWGENLSPVMDSARRLLVVDVSASGETRRFEAPLFELGVGGRVRAMVRLQVEVLICGAVTRPFREMLKANGIQVVAGVSGSSEKILAAFSSGNFDRAGFLMPGWT